MGTMKKYYKTYLLKDLSLLSQFNEGIGKVSKDNKQVTSLIKSMNFLSRNWTKTQKSFF